MKKYPFNSRIWWYAMRTMITIEFKENTKARENYWLLLYNIYLLTFNINAFIFFLFSMILVYQTGK